MISTLLWAITKVSLSLLFIKGKKGKPSSGSWCSFVALESTKSIGMALVVNLPPEDLVVVHSTGGKRVPFKTHIQN